MGLKDKASKINFSSLMAPSVSTGEASGAARGPKTAPGAMLAHANDARSELLKENEDLKNKAALATELESQLGDAVEELRGWQGAKPVRLLDPERVGRSRYANRHASSFESEDFKRLKQEILESGGNVQPIKVRPVVGESFDFEIAFGHRRHEACRQLGMPVLAVIDNLDDRTLFVEMERENRERKDLSPWEQGTMYSRALEAGLFTSIRQLATTLGVDQSNLTKALALAKLPEDVVTAFRSPLDIQLRWAPLLNKALNDDKEGLLKRARDMLAAEGPRSPKVVLANLLGTSKDKLAPIASTSRMVSLNGQNAATITLDSKRLAVVNLLLPLTKEGEIELIAFLERFVKALEPASTHNG